jgi:predicted dehydrogenase
MSMPELRIGVIGAGGRGGLAHYAHRPEEGVRLVAGADVVDAALERFRERYGPDVFVTKDYRELLKRDDIAAVFVTSPDYLHEEHAVAALEAGKHVYLEKPMAVTITGCDRILKAARDHQRKLYLGHNMRHMDVVLTMKRLIDEGAIGEVKAGWCRHFVGYGGDAYFKDWHAERSKSTSLLLQKGAHDIDVLHWLCRGYTTRVVGMGGLTLYDRITDRHDPSERGDASWHLSNWPPLSQKGLNPIIDVEDLSMMLMQLDNGVFCSYQQCHYTPDGWRNYTIIGTEGRIENLGEDMVALWNTRTDYKAQGDKQIPIGEVEGSHGGGDPRIVAEFVRFVREGGKTTTSPIAARMSVAAGYLAAMSLRRGGQPMDVPPVEAEVARYFA